MEPFYLKLVEFNSNRAVRNMYSLDKYNDSLKEIFIGRYRYKYIEYDAQF